MSMTVITQNTANLLLTFICTDGTMTDCEIYQKAIEPAAGVSCEDHATIAGNAARTFKLPDTVVFFCTTDKEAESIIREITGEPAQ